MNAHSLVPGKLFLLIFFFMSSNLPADVQKEVGFDFRGEYNRTLVSSNNFSVLGAVELNDLYTFTNGISLGDTGGEIDIKAFTRSRIGPLFGRLLHFSLAYIYNGLPAYESHTHAILPLVAVCGRWAGITIGPGFRFTSFFGEKPLFESMLSFAGYVNFINNEKLRIGIGLANFSDFYTGTMGAYSPSLNSLIRLNEHWSLTNNIELLQSGSVALAANFYGIAYHGGVRFKW